jgi:putative phosphoribosyl transferase
MNILFANRRDAGRLLARKLSTLGLAENPIVLGLPRGGVPVSFELLSNLTRRWTFSRFAN